MSDSGRKKAWVFQDPKQVAKYGEDKASWYVGWHTPAGRRRCKSAGPGSGGKRLAQREADKLHGLLVAGKYEEEAKANWETFIEKYRKRVLDAKERIGTFEQISKTIAHFERIAKPHRMNSIDDGVIEDYLVARRSERGRKKDSKTSPASRNKELRILKSILRCAHRWGYLAKVPTIKFEREPVKIARTIPADQFSAIYKACKVAVLPAVSNIDPTEWWRALLVMALCTGWRVGELLGLRRADVDLETGVAMTRWETNKGKRDERTPLHSLVVEHLKRIASFDEMIFPCELSRRRLYDQFQAIQKEADIAEPFYGFHDCRRSFATANAGTLTPLQLQGLMRHKSFTTTLKYVAMAPQMAGVIEKLNVPALPGIAQVG